MEFNYNVEIDNILNKLYKIKIFELACKNNISNIELDNLDYYKNLFKSLDVYLGNEVENFIIECLPKEKEGYFFRCNVSKHKNYDYPKIYDASGNKLPYADESKFALMLWEGHINNLIIKDIYKHFKKENFHDYIDNNLENIHEDINKKIFDFKNSNKLTIPFANKSELVNVVKEMILKNELDISFAQDVVDLDKIREEMVLSSTPFDMYNEYDKLEDELEYCLNKFFKYNNNELFNLLVNDKGFEFIENKGLVR